MPRRFNPSIGGKLRVVDSRWYSSGSVGPSPSSGCDFTYCYGGSWVQGKVGNYALDFNGAGDITIPSGSGIPLGNSAGDFTISAWCTQDANDDWDMIASRGDWSSGWLLAKDNTGKMGFGVGTYNTTEVSFTETDTWTHFVGTYDSDAGTTKIYKNGELGGGPGADGGTTSTSQMRIGKEASADRYQWNGKIDEFALWDAQLTPAQISLLSTGSARADSITPPYASDGNWVTGKVDNYALEFDGANDYTSTTSNSAFAFGNADTFSVACWVSSSQGSLQGFVSKVDNDGGSHYGYLIGRNYAGSGFGSNDEFTFTVRAGSNYGYIFSDSAIDDGWHHMVATRNGASGVRMYIDGVLQADTTMEGNLPANLSDNGTPLFCGKWWDADDTNKLDGKLDEVGIWDVVLDQGAVDDLYNSGDGVAANTVSSSALVLYYNMENGPGNNTLTDRSSTGADASFTGLKAGATGSLLLYYDFEIGDNNPVSGNFPTLDTIYDVDTVAWKWPTMHTGTMNGLVAADFGDWQQGKLGKYAIQLDGTNDYVDAGTGLTSLYTDKLTVSLWVYGTFAGDHVFAAQWDYGSTPVARGWQFRVLTGGDVEIGATESGAWSGDFLAAKSTTTLSNNTWYHIVGVYDGSTGPATPKIYINGAAETLSTNTSQGGAFNIGGTIVGGPPELTIGAYLNNGNDTENLQGKIDELSIWSGELSSGEVSSLYNSGAGARADSISPSSATLIAYYDMECDGPGNTNLKDLSGNSLDGTFDTDMEDGTCGPG